MTAMTKCNLLEKLRNCYQGFVYYRSDIYNIYQDCYRQSEYVFGSAEKKQAAMKTLGVDAQEGFVDQGVSFVDQH
jgi:hypothetical protein